MTKFDIEKLKDNAVTSIRLGVEDFLHSQEPNDGEERKQDVSRALSASRNLFAGLLLLMKYKIASSVDDEEAAYNLIRKPKNKNAIPHPDGKGGIRWEPEGGFQPNTIDVFGIEERFNILEIKIDWETIKRIQKTRNGLEHLHPMAPLADIASMLADLFPLLRDFSRDELEEDPAELLGEAWPIMLHHHTFYASIREECEQGWSQTGVPSRMQPWLDRCHCPACFSELLQPHPEDVEEGLKVDDHDFRYKCHVCGQVDLIEPELIREMQYEMDGSDRFSDQPSDFEECDCCHRHTFLTRDGCCQWCDHELEDRECRRCNTPLRQEDQGNGGYCGSCNHERERIMAE